jgi:hypothetical protein
MQKLRLTDGYRIKGFTPYQTIQGHNDDSAVRVIIMKRIQKKQTAPNVE